MHAMATEREENATSPRDLGDTSPASGADRGVDLQPGPVTRYNRNRPLRYSTSVSGP